MSNLLHEKVKIDHRPSSNRRRRRYTVPQFLNCGGSRLALHAQARAAALEDDLSLLALEGHPSRRHVALQPVALQRQPAEVLEAPMRSQKERARLRAESMWGEPMRGEPMWRDRPTGLRMEAMGPKETGSYWGASAAPQLAAIAVCRRKNLPT